MITLSMIEEVKSRIGRNKNILFQNYIQKRLGSCLTAYYESVSKAYDKLSVSAINKELSILKKL